MNYEKILFYIFILVWGLVIVIQHICWILHENYNFVTFIWGLIELSIPYLIYKTITSK